MHTAELLDRLGKHRIPFEAWGTGEANTVEDLLEQIQSGEVELVETEYGELIRRSSAAGVIVLYRDSEGKLFRLNESQTFNDGRTRTRNFPGSVGEKMRQGESPEAAALRALEEELGITGLAIRPYKRFERDRGSQSFPGLRSQGITWLYTVTLPDELYRPYYEEVQPTKVCRFDWAPVRGESTYDAPLEGLTETE